ncbi:MAG: hypothetical protein IPL40_13405 [Proteobacteria bacterium]|nr:hypothetical protein [Pseudomonadota bacterium]
MKRKAAETGRRQEVCPQELSFAMQQLALPMVLASEAIKKGLFAFVQQMGMLAFTELLQAEAEAIVGAKGRHLKGRTHHHWGAASTPLPFGGRQAVVDPMLIA